MSSVYWRIIRTSWWMNRASWLAGGQRRLTARNALFLAIWGAWAVTRFAGYMIVDDDAMISFAYSRNLVEGNGFVFNPGERVYGTTAPLFALFAAAGMVLGFAPWDWVLAFDVLWAGVVLWRLRQLLELCGWPGAFPLAGGLLVIAFPYTMPVPGMETFLFIALIASALASCGAFLARGGSPVAPVAWGTGAALLRPDGVLVLGVVAAFVAERLLRERAWRRLAWAYAPMLALPMFWLAAGAWFGAVVPHSMQAKAANTQAVDFRGTFWFRHLEYLVWSYQAPHLLALGVLGGWIGCVRRKAGRPLAAFYLVYFGVFALGRAPNVIWYRSPLIVLEYAFAGAAIFLLARGLVRLGGGRFSRLRGVPGGPIAVAVLSVLLAVLLLVPQRTAWKGYSRYLRDLGVGGNLRGYRDVALYLSESRAPEDPLPLVAAHEIGYLGYFRAGRVFDLQGLVTPRVAEARRQNPHADLLAESGAAWFVYPVGNWEPEPPEHPVARNAEALGYRIHRVFVWPDGQGRTLLFEKGP
ncbi:MAG: hypothetical protein RLY93_06895 [Sumerlaeia bacterium]